MSATVDLFTLEVIRHAFSAIAEEMSLVVMRSARSPLLREAGDLSSAITDTDGELVAQGRDIPMHMGVMSFTVKEFLKRVPVERLSAGDVWFLNLPEIGGNHLPDVKAVRPVFVDGVLRAFAVSLAHWADIGGAVPGSYVPWATDAWQEGLRLPPVRLFTAAGSDREKLDLVLANVRGAREREGDILAQMAATRVAEQRLQALCERHGGDNIALAMGQLHDHAEQQMIAALKSLPAGTYHGEDWLAQVLHYIEENFLYLQEFIAENIPDIKVIPLEGTYLVWLDFRELGLEPKELEKFMRGKAKVALDEGYIFGQGGEGFERINIACPKSILEEALNRITEAIINMKKKEDYD